MPKSLGEDNHFLLRLIAERNPEVLSISIDSVEVFRAKFTEQGLETLLDLPIDASKQRWMMTISLDNDPIPVYSLSLGGETG
ncbi:MAG: hypothetical protein HLUCCA11_21215 [Phormidesmis priestleyi Ana]|uniref:Uncharacterized protein n=1 Tax=Phormidesmis priestleyi Ana TaxID=1666911 RepID=A0A0P7YQP0_9CYAN|nr:MAG: hypothetical protein HLUCCA11_21215 [Phormidesmis priestleyi Ana]